VSSFGFGGANFHVVLSEHRPESTKKYSAPSGGQEIKKETTTMKTDSKILAVGGNNREKIEQALEERLTQPREQDPILPPEEVTGADERLLISHANDKERTARAQRALKALQSDQPEAWRALSNQGIFRGRGQRTKIAFLFPGQGSQ
jgi:acyl transferase domain-containing protein